jgi:hypothetical protein
MMTFREKRSAPLRMVAWLSALITFSTGASAAETISYRATVGSAAQGGEHAVEFQGKVVGKELGGVVTIDGESRSVSGTVAKDGSVSGRLSGPDGKQVGVFWGQRVGNALKGNFDLGGNVGEWSVPANRVPVPE